MDCQTSAPGNGRSKKRQRSRGKGYSKGLIGESVYLSCVFVSVCVGVYFGIDSGIVAGVGALICTLMLASVAILYLSFVVMPTLFLSFEKILIIKD